MPPAALPQSLHNEPHLLQGSEGELHPQELFVQGGPAKILHGAHCAVQVGVHVFGHHLAAEDEGMDNGWERWDLAATQFPSAPMRRLNESHRSTSGVNLNRGPQAQMTQI